MTDTALTFTDAEPVKTATPGRKAGPNPFTDVIAAIALQEKDGKPVAKAFPIEHTDGERDKAIERYRRQLTAAGDANDPKVTVKVVGTPAKEGPKGKEKDSATKTNVTFWTVTKQTRPRKPTSGDAVHTASTEQATAVANPA